MAFRRSVIVLMLFLFQSLRSLRDSYNKGSGSGATHAKTVDLEFCKSVPDLNWIHDQIVAGWDGGPNAPVVNASGQTLLHLMAMIGSPKVFEISFL